MNKKLFELGVQSGVLVEDSREPNYGYEINEFIDTDSIVEYAHLLINECMDIAIENTTVFDLSEKGMALRKARRQIFYRFYGDSNGK